MQHLAIVAYRSIVAGIPSRSLDFQVRWFQDLTRAEIEESLRAEPFDSYQNPAGETVLWELVEIFAIEEFSPKFSGIEVAGFIAQLDELQDLL